MCSCTQENAVLDKFSVADSVGHGGTSPYFYKWLSTVGGTVSRRTANKKLTKLHVLTITKALTKTTNCTFRAKKVEGHDQKFLSRRIGPPLSLGTGAPQFQIRSGATG